MEEKVDSGKIKKPVGRPQPGPVPEGYYYHPNYGPMPNELKYYEYRLDEYPGYSDEKTWKPTKKTRCALISFSNVYNLGVRWIQSTAMHAGYDCHAIFFGQLLANDWKPPSEKDWEHLEIALKEINPHVIGLSISCSSYWLEVLEVDKFVKKVCPNAIVIWGSIHVSVMPDQCFEHNDVLCLGEGEMPFMELLDRLENGLPWHDIANLWVRDRKTGQVFKNPMRPVIRDLDSIPGPIWDNKNKWYIRRGMFGRETDPAFKEYYIFLMTNRGCPYHCNYCVNSVYNQGDYRACGHHRLRQRSVDHVLNEMERMRGRYPNFDNLPISFFDDIFTLNPAWVIEFSQKYKERFKNHFWCYFHPNNIREDVMDALKECGLSHVDMGVQTGSERIRIDLMKRPETNDVIREACHILKERGIAIVMDVITDIPFETEEDMANSLEFFLSLPRPYEFNFYSLIYFPGVTLTQMALDGGYIKEEDVEHLAGKTLNQFVATFKYKDRKPRDKFYIPLFRMACRPIYSKNFVRWLAKNRWLEKYPWILFRLVDLQNILDIIRKLTKIPQRMREGMTWGRLYSYAKVYFLWERPYNK
ncbi:MAG TPA: B12-binding domain-containing radical SAM protein [Firmicutes bacterium]|nr:B12-binding domain-containing radical SAM protein [Bacillota bacterium]